MTPDRDTGAWEAVLWDELDQLTPQQQFIVAGEWITRMTQVLLPALGARRRENILSLIEVQGWDTLQVAESLGTRRATVARLADEGRTRRRMLAIKALQQSLVEHVVSEDQDSGSGED